MTEKQLLKHIENEFNKDPELLKKIGELMIKDICDEIDRDDQKILYGKVINDRDVGRSYRKWKKHLLQTEGERGMDNNK